MKGMRSRLCVYGVHRAGKLFTTRDAPISLSHGALPMYVLRKYLEEPNFGQKLVKDKQVLILRTAHGLEEAVKDLAITTTIVSSFRNPNHLDRMAKSDAERFLLQGSVIQGSSRIGLPEQTTSASGEGSLTFAYGDFTKIEGQLYDTIINACEIVDSESQFEAIKSLLKKGGEFVEVGTPEFLGVPVGESNISNYLGQFRHDWIELLRPFPYRDRLMVVRRSIKS